MTEPHRGRQAQWRAGPAEDLVWAEFGEDYVVYHRPSGKTHFLNTASAALLREVLVCPQTAVAAAEELAAREAAPADAEFHAAVTAWLVQLEHLGLVGRLDD
jgi:PqqD family protein of HPr-rel-A system